MAALKHFNPKAGAPPYKGLFSTVTVVPPNTSLAYISSQWAADANGELVEGTAGDYAKQVKITWEHVIGILKELGVDFKSVVHRTINFLEFNEEIGKVSVEAALSVTPDEWKADVFSSSLTFNGQAFFHAPGIVYTVELIVAVPAK